MIVGGLLLALVLGLLLTALIAAGFGGYRGWDDLLAFFVLVFMAAWAAGVWLGAGPLWWDFYWLPALIVGAVVAVVFFATRRPRVPRYDAHAPEFSGADEEVAEATAEAAITFLGATVWVWVVLLLLAVLIRFLV